MSHVSKPWVIINDNICYDSDYGGPFLAICEKVSPGNANIIAAAPEMLEALELFIHYGGSKDNEGLQQLNNAYRIGLAAIKKAKGGP